VTLLPRQCVAFPVRCARGGCVRVCAGRHTRCVTAA
jgi:hypothetical protein